MKLSHRVLAVVIHIGVVGLSLQSFADREDFHKPSKELAEAIATAATAKGYDLSSKDGRKQFGDYIKSQRDTLATSLGIDMSTEEGRQKYKETVKTHVDQVATAQNIDLTTKEGRDALEKYLITNGEFAYVRPDPKDRRGPREHDQSQQNGDVQSGDKKFAGDMKEGCHKDQANNQQGERKGPPPPREQRQGTSADQANGGNTQVQRPEQRQ